MRRPAGRGRSPAPFEPVDHLRWTAYLLSEAKDWPAAKGAFGALLRSEPEDWALLSGAVFCWAHGLVAAVEQVLSGTPEGPSEEGSGLAGPLLALLSPWGEGPGGDAARLEICGDAAVDARLEGVLRRALAATSSPQQQQQQEQPEDLSSVRASILALLLAAGTRAELCHRLLAHAGTPEGLRAPLTAVLGALGAQYARLCTAFVVGVGHKACAFIDVRDALLPLLPPTHPSLRGEDAEASLSAVATPPGAEPKADVPVPSGHSGLGSFLSPRPKLIAVPFDSPVLPVGRFRAPLPLPRAPEKRGRCI